EGEDEREYCLSDHAPAPVQVERILASERGARQEREPLHQGRKRVPVRFLRSNGFRVEQPDRDSEEDCEHSAGEYEVPPRERAVEQQGREEERRVHAGDGRKATHSHTECKQDEPECRTRAGIDCREEEDAAEAKEERECQGKEQEQGPDERDAGERRSQHIPQAERQDPEEEVIDRVLDNEVCEDELLGEREAPG